MTTLLVKKRKFTDINDSNFAYSSPKFFLDNTGLVKKNFAEYFKNLNIMFPIFSLNEIEMEFINSKEDLLLTIDCLKNKQIDIERMKEPHVIHPQKEIIYQIKIMSATLCPEKSKKEP